MHTIPVYETVEAIGMLQAPLHTTDKSVKGKGKKKEESAEQCIWTAGDFGRVRVWNFKNGKEVPAAAQGAGKPHEIIYTWCVAQNYRCSRTS
jgi:hypothetical protein